MADEERSLPQGLDRAVERNPLFLTGASVYPLNDEADGPDQWYAHDVGEELDSLARAHCSLVRIFIGWRAMEPQVGQYDEDVLERLVELVDAIGKRKMQTLVCFFADDRHADLATVPWGQKRDPRTDSYLVQREAALVSKVVSSLHSRRAVFAWQLGNEAFLSGFKNADDLAAWVATLRESVREHDTKRPIGIGADAETLLRSTGVDARSVVAGCDFVVAHLTSAYRAYAAGGPLTSVSASYLEPFLLRCAHDGIPVLLDETGPLSLEYSAQEEADALRVSLWSALCNRAAGALARRARDMSTDRREPYYLDPFEVLVGVVDEDGEEKPSYDELASFVSASASVDLGSYHAMPERVGVLMPAERYEPLPSLAGLYAPRACFQAFVTAKRAQLPVALVREGASLADFRLLIVPSVFKLLPDTWPALAAFVQSGGSLLLSYGGGELPAEAASLFGVEFLGDSGPRRDLECRVAQSTLLGDITGFDVHLEIESFAGTSPRAATVVATDAAGNPLLCVNQVGQGKAILISAPLERAIAQSDPWASPPPVLSLLREVYSAAARSAGCAAPFKCDVPEVEVTVFAGDVDDVVVLINHLDEKVAATVSCTQPVATATDLRSGSVAEVGSDSFGVPLAACGVAVLLLTYR